MRSLLVVSCLVLAIHSAPAQTERTAHTVRRDDGAPLAKATLADAAWLVGHWTGEALGGTVEEIWVPAAGGSMLGMFRLIADDRARFYELFALVEVDGGLVLKLKHFHADMTGWEDKDTTVDFALVAHTPDELRFDGMTIRREGPDALTIHLAMRGKDGVDREEILRYRRVGS